MDLHTTPLPRTVPAKPANNMRVIVVHSKSIVPRHACMSLTKNRAPASNSLNNYVAPASSKTGTKLSGIGISFPRMWLYEVQSSVAFLFWPRVALGSVAAGWAAAWAAAHLLSPSKIIIHWSTISGHRVSRASSMVSSSQLELLPRLLSLLMSLVLFLCAVLHFFSKTLDSFSAVNGIQGRAGEEWRLCNRMLLLAANPNAEKKI